IRQVASCGGERNGGLDDECAAAIEIEQCGEDARGIEVRKTEPVDAAVQAHERGSPSVPDYGVIANRSEGAAHRVIREVSRRPAPASWGACCSRGSACAGGCSAA